MTSATKHDPYAGVRPAWATSKPQIDDFSKDAVWRSPIRRLAGVDLTLTASHTFTRDGWKSDGPARVVLEAGYVELTAAQARRLAAELIAMADQA